MIYKTKGAYSIHIYYDDNDKPIPMLIAANGAFKSYYHGGLLETHIYINKNYGQEGEQLNYYYSLL